MNHRLLFPVKLGAEVGYPLLVKASAGGGGRGMRIVESADTLEESVASAAREATSAFADGTVFLERYVQRPRHVEIQVMADTHGGTVAPSSHASPLHVMVAGHDSHGRSATT